MAKALNNAKAPRSKEQIILEAIARECFPNIETLETRNSDSLDFHDVAVWAIKAALEAAYAAGKADAGK